MPSATRVADAPSMPAQRLPKRRLCGRLPFALQHRPGRQEHIKVPAVESDANGCLSQATPKQFVKK